MAKKQSRAEIVFKEELEFISCQNLRRFIIECFDKLAADYFWDFTASSSGLHHPKIDNKRHGLVLHTKFCVWWGLKLAESFGYKNKTDIDIIVSSLLLHDLQKFGKKLDDNDKPTLSEYSSSHGPLLSIQFDKLFYAKTNREQNKIEKYDNFQIIDKISACIALHMGIWTNEYLGYRWKQIYNNDNMVKVVHLADYCASRKVDDKMKELDDFKDFGE